jgi:RNA polymerase sigma-70 factor, ECF subfamily
VTARDASDLAGLRAGDVRAFEAVFRAYYARLCGFAYSYLQNRAEAEEIVQDVFLALWQKQETLVLHTSLKAYLFRAVRNRVLNRNARARVEQRWLEENDPARLAVADPEPSPQQKVEEAQTAERLRAAIESLPSGCQTVLRLRWEQQLSYAEIAETLGISEKGVENQLARARKVLRGVV